MLRQGARRVAITGLGICSPVGIGIANFWQSILNDKSGITSFPDDFSFLPCRVAGLIQNDLLEEKLKEFNHYFNKKNLYLPVDWRRLSRASSFGVLAAFEALSQANWLSSLSHDESDSEEFRLASYRAGIHFGTGMEGIAEVMQSGPSIRSRKYAGIGPHALTRGLANMPAGIISQVCGLRGPCMASNTACATGLHSIGDAYRMIQNNEADLVLAGGCEAPLNPWAVAAFSRIRALATRFNDAPESASRPFDARRDGFVMSEGAAAVVLQAWPPTSALSHWQRSTSSNCTVKPIAEVIGFGRSGDAYSLVSPDPIGDGAYRSMLSALHDARLSGLSQVGHINCHATSTPIGDEIELAAIGRLLTTFNPSDAGLAVPVVNSIKGHIGHTLGAAGALETVYTALAVSKGQIAINKNLVDPIKPNEVGEVLKRANSPILCDISAIDRIVGALDQQVFLPRNCCQPVAWPNEQLDHKASRRIALTNSFGFGGTNGTLVIAEWKE